MILAIRCEPIHSSSAVVDAVVVAHAVAVVPPSGRMSPLMLLLRHRRQSPRLRRLPAAAVCAVHIGIIPPLVARRTCRPDSPPIVIQSTRNQSPSRSRASGPTSNMTRSTFPSDVVFIVCGSTSAPIAHPPRYDDSLVTTRNDSIPRTLLPPRAGELLLLLRLVILLLMMIGETTSMNIVDVDQDDGGRRERGEGGIGGASASSYPPSPIVLVLLVVIGGGGRGVGGGVTKIGYFDTYLGTYLPIPRHITVTTFQLIPVGSRISLDIILGFPPHHLQWN